jgi:hypothetical protein
VRRDRQDRDALAYDAAQHAWFTGFLDRLFGSRGTAAADPAAGLATVPA